MPLLQIFPKFIILCLIIKIIDTNKSTHLRWNKKLLTTNWTLNIRDDQREEKAKICLKNTTKCINEDSTYEIASNQLAQYLFSAMPPLDLSQSPTVGQSCRTFSKLYITELRNFKLWALKMYDSSAKLPSGLLNGNINQFGDFDMCLNANEPNLNVYGKYCLASLQVETTPFTSPYISALHKLVHSHYHFKTHLSDPEHRVPQFSSTKWAICIPNTCTAQDLQNGLKEQLDKIFKGTELTVSVKIKEEMCNSQADNSTISNGTKIAGAIFIGFVLIAIVSAIYDFSAIEGYKNEWIMAFSLRKNFNSLISLKRPNDDIEAIHAIRCFNAILLLLAHKSMALFFPPYTNRTEMIEFLSKSWTVLGRAASLYTDPFIMISGTLTAYSLFGKLQKKQRISIGKEYISRLMRIVPTFCALIAFCTLILPKLGSGPMWNLVVTHHAQICERNWWRNMLFIHNYFGLADMCLTHTHHVGIDTQLFFLSPIFVLILWKWPRKGAAVLIGLAGISTLLRYQVTQTLKLSNYVHFGTSIKQLFDTADNMYILPLHRLTVYVMGIFLGYILRTKIHLSLTPNQFRFGNAMALLSFAISFCGNAFMGNINYKYNSNDAAWYAAFSPILWCFTFAWIIFTTHIGCNTIFEKISSFKYFLLWTKISYTVYLTQFPIFFYNVGMIRSSEQYSFFRMMFDLKEIASIIIASIILTLLFESPFQNIRNIVFKKQKEFRECGMKKIS